MERHEELKIKIEEVRDELNKLYESGDVIKYADKSAELDKLIEEFIDLEDELGLLDLE